MKVYEAVVKPASGGFGMGQVGEWCEVEGAESLQDWLDMAGDVEEVPAGEMPYTDVYNGSGRTLYRHSPRTVPDFDIDGGEVSSEEVEWSYCMVDVQD